MIVRSEKTLALFRGPGLCEYCGCRCVREVHHALITKGRGRLDVPMNLIAAGSPFDCCCHDQAHRQVKDFKARSLKIISLREHLAGDYIVAALNRLLRAPKDVAPCPHCHGSGIYNLPIDPINVHCPCITCACSGVVMPDGSPWIEKPRKFSGVNR